MAYLLRIFENDLRTAIEGIMQIRNLFAHDLEAAFDSPDKDMVTAVGKLNLHEGRTHIPSAVDLTDTTDPILKHTSNHGRFIVNLQIALNLLSRDNFIKEKAMAYVRALSSYQHHGTPKPDPDEYLA